MHWPRRATSSSQEVRPPWPPCVIHKLLCVHAVLLLLLRMGAQCLMRMATSYLASCCTPHVCIYFLLHNYQNFVLAL